MTTATRSSGRKQQTSRQSGSRSTQTRQSGRSSRSSRSGQASQSGQSQTSQSQSGQSQSSQSQSGQSTGASASSRSASSGGKTDRAHETTVELPFVTAQFHAPEVHVPNRNDLASAASAVRSRMPSRDHALFYGALGLSAAFAVIDWPVALAVGVGTALVNRSSQQASSSE